MNTLIVRTICFSVLTLVFNNVQAVDINAGKAKAAQCGGCHGSNGVSSSPLWPSLAGQSASYLQYQLSQFKSGGRENATMQAMAKGLSEEDMANLAAYFASLPAKSAGGDAALAKTGKDKAGMCMGCHGQTLQGNGHFPRLAGQQPQYLAKQLNDFKSGARKTGPMNAVAANLSDEDIKALSAYMAGL